MSYSNKTYRSVVLMIIKYEALEKHLHEMAAVNILFAESYLGTLPAIGENRWNNDVTVF